MISSIRRIRLSYAALYLKITLEITLRRAVKLTLCECLQLIRSGSTGNDPFPIDCCPINCCPIDCCPINCCPINCCPINCCAAILAIAFVTSECATLFMVGPSDNNVIRLLAQSNSTQHASSAESAIAASEHGDGVMLLAESYPQNRTIVPWSAIETAVQRGVRFYVEYPDQLPTAVDAQLSAIMQLSRRRSASHCRRYRTVGDYSFNSSGNSFRGAMDPPAGGQHREHRLTWPRETPDSAVSRQRSHR